MNNVVNGGVSVARSVRARYRVVTYDELRNKANIVAKSILEKYSKFDSGIVVAPILMGGGLPARLIVDALLPFGVVSDVVPCQIKRYEAIENAGATEIILGLDDSRIVGQIVVGIDDLVDGGETCNAFREHAMLKGAKLVDIAVIYFKPQSKFIPDHYAESGISEWLILPGEEHEFMSEIVTSDESVRALSVGKREEYFKNLGFPAEIVSDWAKLH